jgi:peptidoglycan glycosyltransferase
MIEDVISKNGKEIHHFSPQKNGRIMTIEEADLLKKNLNEVIEVSFDWLFGESEYSLLGKSGTAQYGTNGMEHSWFVSYSPSESPQIAVCVIVEDSNIQNITAVEVTKKIYDYYYSR